MWSLSGIRKKNKSLSSSAGLPEPEQETSVKLLVIQADDYDWEDIFSGVVLKDRRRIEVVQAGWDDITVHADTYSSSTRPIVEIRSNKVTGEKQKTFLPDFLLIRNEVMTPSFDGRTSLSGFLFADIPSVNSLLSIYQFCDRAAMMGCLHRINRRLGDAFPVIPQHFASGSRTLMYGYTFPAVVKVGSAHAGAGKMKITDHHQMSDFRSVLAMMPSEHCFVEPFVEGAFDLRIQKIGSHYRAFRRQDISGEWKTNTGTALLDEVVLEPRWKIWADEAAAMFGGLEILTVDAIVEEGTGKEYILEVNGTSSGLHPDCAEEDNNHIRDVVLEKMNTPILS
mmetsp:Transcript_14775/g.31824  ORF Transcript_14775/g.31824 Transcript_14775/m.31824 type:complete len:338 (+) Transcript_14775:60-1073(+)